MKRLVVFISVCCWVLLMQSSIHNVKDYGARADGVTIDSPAINRAISAATGEGGGTVYIPAGEYACYSIRLASHVHLYLEHASLRHRLLRRVDMMRLSRTNITVIRTLVIAIGKTP